MTTATRRIKPLIGWRTDAAPTLRLVWLDYQQARPLKQRTFKEYEGLIDRCLGDWLDRPLTEITKKDIASRHQMLTHLNSRHGGGATQANQAMRLLRAFYTFAMHKYDDEHENPIIKSNPVRVLSGTRSWNKSVIRTGWIKPHEMRAWFEAVSSLGEPWTDYLVLLILTGLRRTEGQRLQWKDVDFEVRTLTVRATKNGDDHELPMSDYIYALLKRRHDSAFRYGDREWVFPGRNGKYKCVRNNFLIPGAPPFMPHDLRRTFLTVASGLNLNGYTIKMLANHRVSPNDVTSRYVIRSIEQLREPMQRITDEILRQAGLRRTEKAQTQAKGEQTYSFQFSQCTTNISVSGFGL